MAKRFQPPPTIDEIEIAKRVKTSRRTLRMSERLVALQTGLSREQLRRIERGEVPIRFFPAWSFCRFANLNPLWLAFGTGFCGERGLIKWGREGFLECANSEVPDDALFFDVMRVAGVDYFRYRDAQYDQWERVGTIFSKVGPAPEMRSSRPISNDALYAEIELAISKREYYSHLMLSADHVGNWEELRLLLQKALSPRGAKKEVAERFGISSQAVSHWLSGKSAPPADTALQLRKWLADASRNPKQESAGTAVTVPAPNDPKGKIKSDEKTKSDQRKR